MSKIKEIYTFFSNLKTKVQAPKHNSVSNCIENVQNNIPIASYMPILNKQDIYTVCKNKCIQALQGKNPYEKVFILNKENNTIIKELDGDLGCCYIDKIFLKRGPLKILHGHTSFENNCTSPVSFQDFKLLNDNPNIVEISAFDSLGKESVLKKNDNYSCLSKKQFNDLKNTYIKYLLEYADKPDREKILELHQYCKTHEKSRAVQAKIAELLTELQYKKGGVNAIDAFWRENAERLNITYKPY